MFDVELGGWNESPVRGGLLLTPNKAKALSLPV